MNEKYFNFWAESKGGIDYNFKDVFVSQSDLCNKIQQLEYPRSNPLTIRLCLLQEVFCRLFDSRLNVRQKVSNPGYIYHPTRNSMALGTASSLVVTSEGFIGDEINLNLHEIYKDFYAFLSFFCSALDRLAYEIHLIYDIGGKYEIDWRKFKGKDNKLGELFNKLKSKNSDLANIVNSSDFSEVLIFRDGLEHGKDDLEINGSSFLNNKFDFLIQNDEEMRIVDFCQKKFTDLLQTCEEIYKVILN